ncbi:hypothetical protein PCE1_001781 [Barthelona sp. PCE]
MRFRDDFFQYTVGFLMPGMNKQLPDVYDFLQNEGIVVAVKDKIKISKQQAEEIFSEHVEAEYWPALLSTVTKKKVNAFVLAHFHAVDVWSDLVGPEVFTNPVREGALPFTSSKNPEFGSGYGSKTIEDVERDLKWFFPSFSPVIHFRAILNRVLRHRFFICPSFEIYAGVKGLYDYGPQGTQMESRELDLWKRHFVRDNVYMMKCTALTPEPVLKASGHVKRFTDAMVADENVTPVEHFRADHLLEDQIEKLLALNEEERAAALQTLREQAPEENVHLLDDLESKENLDALMVAVDGLKVEEMGKLMSCFEIYNPNVSYEDMKDEEKAKHRLLNPFDFNLMFKTSIGPSGKSVGFLRPETAQGLFVNFQRLYAENGKKLPFGGAQLGIAFRNEIAPRSGLLRLREFMMAELEFFHSPHGSECPLLYTVEDVVLPLFDRERQNAGGEPLLVTVKDALEQGHLKNVWLAYFLGRAKLFFTEIGIDPERLRFRQHLDHQMSHYASDCWDAESLLSYGWTEIAGFADRHAYDLNAHMKGCGADLRAFIDYPEPKIVRKFVATPNKKVLGRVLRKQFGDLTTLLAEASEEELISMNELKEKGEFEFNGHNISNDVEFIWEESTVTGEFVVPAVIEPSFGVGRVLYTVWEHCFRVRPTDARRIYFEFPIAIAPASFVIIPLRADCEKTLSLVREVKEHCHRLNIKSITETANISIGKRYARTDEIGIPYAVTFDTQSLEDGSATIRDRDSGDQLRVPRDEIPSALQNLASSHWTWDNMCEEFEAFENKVEF